MGGSTTSGCRMIAADLPSAVIIGPSSEEELLTACQWMGHGQNLDVRGRIARGRRLTKDLRYRLAQALWEMTPLNPCSCSPTCATANVREAVDLLALLADNVHAAVLRAGRLAYAILDGTLIPIDRLADERPYYSGKHRRHGVNVQVLADPVGRLVWASPAPRTT